MVLAVMEVANYYHHEDKYPHGQLHEEEMLEARDNQNKENSEVPNDSQCEDGERTNSEAKAGKEPENNEDDVDAVCPPEIQGPDEELAILSHMDLSPVHPAKNDTEADKGEPNKSLPDDDSCGTNGDLKHDGSNYEEDDDDDDDIGGHHSLSEGSSLDYSSIGDLSRSKEYVPTTPVTFSHLDHLPTSGQKSYDYLLKVLLVGDSDVGKQEILEGFEDGTTESPFCSSVGAAFKQTIILIDGKRVKLQLWDTSGQGRFCTILRSYSRGAQGILLVYDITNRWSFEGIDRWLKEVEQHAPGIPKVLIGNRLHLAFKRQVGQLEAEHYAEKNSMGFFEVSPLVNFNVSESFVELARMALKRNGMERLWKSNKVSSLYELCAYAVVNRTTVYGIDRLPIPDSIKQNLKSYATMSSTANRKSQRLMQYKSLKHKKNIHNQPPPTPAAAAKSKKLSCGPVSTKSCVIT